MQTKEKSNKRTSKAVKKDNQIPKSDEIAPISIYARPSSFPEGSIFVNYNFLKLWGAQIFSQIAIYLLYFVLAVEIYKETGSNQSVSYLMISFGLASLLFGAFAGVFVDHANKKAIMLASNLFRFGLTLVVLGATHSFIITILLVFLLNSITQFFLPAEASTMPKIVKGKNLLTANSLFTLSLYGAQMTGYVLGGFLLNSHGFTISIITIAFMFGIAALFNFFLKIPNDKYQKLPVTDMAHEVFTELKEGLSYIKKNKKVRIPLAYMSGSMVMVAVFFTLVPGYGANILGIAPEDTSFYLIAPLAVGMILGAITINYLKKRMSLEKITSTGIFLSAILLFILAINRRIPFAKIREATTDKIDPTMAIEFHNAVNHLPDKVNKIFGLDVLLFSMILMVLLGLANSFVVIVNNTRLQADTKEEMRGRVYGVLQTIVTAIAAVPVVLSGYFADRYGIGKVLIAIAAFVIIFHLFIRVRNKKSIF